MKQFAHAVCAAIFIAVAAPAIAQQDTEILPTRKTTNQQIGDWSVTCTSSEGGSKSCAMAQRLSDAKTKQVVLAWLVGLNAAGDKVITLRTPLGLLLHKGIVLQVDDNPHLIVSFRTCIKAFCEAAHALDRSLLGLLKNGRVARVELQNLQGKTLKFNVSLRGFSKAYGILLSELKQS